MFRFVLGLLLVMGAMASVELFSVELMAGAITGVIGLVFTWWPLLDGTLVD